MDAAEAWATDEHTWPGVILERKIWEILGGKYTNAYVDMWQDWYFQGTDLSAFGSLLGIHNATVKAVGMLAMTMEKAVPVEKLALLTLRLRIR